MESSLGNSPNERLYIDNLIRNKFLRKAAVLDSYQHDPERYFATIRQMPIEEQEVSLLIAAACGVDINNF